ncbi:MAG: ankyrin repeat domain-containing protein, partial [Rhodoferax sp.]
MTEPTASTELTALFFFSAVHAGSLPEAQTLLARGVSINARDASDRTTLMVAVQAGHASLERRLLELGAVPGLTDSADLTVMQYGKKGATPNGTDLRKLFHKNNHLYS